MKCPFCGEDTTRVIDSRPAEDNTAIRRRRLCESCGRRFKTIESREAYPVMVVKKDQSREPFSKDKLRAGIQAACHKRPIPAECVNRMIDEIESAVTEGCEKEIPSSRIGEMVMERLKDIDEVAYVRFASVYRSFTDVNTFAEELKSLLKKEIN